MKLLRVLAYRLPLKPHTPRRPEQGASHNAAYTRFQGDGAGPRGRDPEFREGLLNEAVGALLGGEAEVGKALLRDYINATVGFDELGRLTDKSPKSLMRMFGPNGNPQARNLFEVINQIQRHEGVRLHVTAVR